MADTENVAEDVTEISRFLLILLKEGNYLLHQNSTTEEFKYKVTTYLELLEVTTKMLEAFIRFLKTRIINFVGKT